jgi:hypothetical protein
MLHANDLQVAVEAWIGVTVWLMAWLVVIYLYFIGWCSKKI